MLKFSRLRSVSSMLLLSGVSLAPFAHASAQDALTAKPVDEKGLETIIVTAQHRKEKAQDVPISISTVSGKSLETPAISN